MYNSLVINWQLPFLIQEKGENDQRRYFTVTCHKKMLLTAVGIEPETKIDDLFILSRKIGSDISQCLPRKYQSLLSRKKNISKCRLLKFLPSKDQYVLLQCHSTSILTCTTHLANSADNKLVLFSPKVEYVMQTLAFAAFLGKIRKIFYISKCLLKYLPRTNSLHAG